MARDAAGGVGRVETRGLASAPLPHLGPESVLRQEAGDYFAGSEITPEPIALTFTCTLELVVCNLSNQPLRVPLARAAPTDVRLASAPGVAHVGDAVDLPGESVAILQAVEHS